MTLAWYSRRLQPSPQAGFILMVCVGRFVSVPWVESHRWGSAAWFRDSQLSVGAAAIWMRRRLCLSGSRLKYYTRDDMHTCSCSHSASFLRSTPRSHFRERSSYFVTCRIYVLVVLFTCMHIYLRLIWRQMWEAKKIKNQIGMWNYAIRN